MLARSWQLGRDRGSARWIAAAFSVRNILLRVLRSRSEILRKSLIKEKRLETSSISALFSSLLMLVMEI